MEDQLEIKDEGICCYCGYECNPFSQSCGTCSRGLSGVAIGIPVPEYLKTLEGENYIFSYESEVHEDEKYWTAKFVKFEGSVLIKEEDIGDCRYITDYKSSKLKYDLSVDINCRYNDKSSRSVKRLDGPFYIGEVWTIKQLRSYNNRKELLFNY
jgi:hypothetical protein